MYTLERIMITRVMWRNGHQQQTRCTIDVFKTDGDVFHACRTYTERQVDDTRRWVETWRCGSKGVKGAAMRLKLALGLSMHVISDNSEDGIRTVVRQTPIEYGCQISEFTLVAQYLPRQSCRTLTEVHM